MKVRQIMTRTVVACQTNADLATAGQLMLQARCGSVPVMDSQGRIAGVITDRDIAMAAATRQRNAAHIAVFEAMTPKVRSCAADDDVAVALTEMQRAHVRRLAVLDDRAHLVGILSIDDIAARALETQDGISPGQFAKAFREICAVKPPPRENGPAEAGPHPPGSWL